ncbi:MAG: hypothetical protein IKJ88_05465 [Clostridia bacterium]|nr:hypothetical protein [Clostridia bacterium]
MSKANAVTENNTPENNTPENNTSENNTNTNGTTENNDASKQTNKKGAASKKEEYEEIFIPKTSKNDDAQFISVNGKRILVKKGIPVKVPKAHAEVWKNSQKQTAKNDVFIAENSTN